MIEVSLSTVENCYVSLCHQIPCASADRGDVARWRASGGGCVRSEGSRSGGKAVLRHVLCERERSEPHLLWKLRPVAAMSLFGPTTASGHSPGAAHHRHAERTASAGVGCPELDRGTRSGRSSCTDRRDTSLHSFGTSPTSDSLSLADLAIAHWWFFLRACYAMARRGDPSPFRILPCRLLANWRRQSVESYGRLP